MHEAGWCAARTWRPRVASTSAGDLDGILRSGSFYNFYLKSAKVAVNSHELIGLPTARYPDAGGRIRHLGLPRREPECLEQAGVPRGPGASLSQVLPRES